MTQVKNSFGALLFLVGTVTCTFLGFACGSMPIVLRVSRRGDKARCACPAEKHMAQFPLKISHCFRSIRTCDDPQLRHLKQFEIPRKGTGLPGTPFPSQTEATGHHPSHWDIFHGLRAAPLPCSHKNSLLDQKVQPFNPTREHLVALRLQNDAAGFEQHFHRDTCNECHLALWPQETKRTSGPMCPKVKGHAETSRPACFDHLFCCQLHIHVSTCKSRLDLCHLPELKRRWHAAMKKKEPDTPKNGFDDHTWDLFGCEQLMTVQWCKLEPIIGSPEARTFYSQAETRPASACPGGPAVSTKRCSAGPCQICAKKHLPMRLSARVCVCVWACARARVRGKDVPAGCECGVRPRMPCASAREGARARLRTPACECERASARA